MIVHKILGSVETPEGPCCNSEGTCVISEEKQMEHQLFVALSVEIGAWSHIAFLLLLLLLQFQLQFHLLLLLAQAYPWTRFGLTHIFQEVAFCVTDPSSSNFQTKGEPPTQRIMTLTFLSAPQRRLHRGCYAALRCHSLFLVIDQHAIDWNARVLPLNVPSALVERTRLLHESLQKPRKRHTSWWAMKCWFARVQICVKAALPPDV